MVLAMFAASRLAVGCTFDIYRLVAVALLALAWLAVLVIAYAMLVALLVLT
jgi:hypothetical protein